MLHQALRWPTRRGAFRHAQNQVRTGCISPQIEHRLFSHISMNWRGRPLTSHDVIVQTIAATTTSTGLSVHAELDTDPYATGVKIPDSQMKDLSDSGVLTRHDWHPEWNYTLRPTPK